MNDEKIKIYRWAGLHWDVAIDINGESWAFALCPRQKCHCKLNKSKKEFVMGEYKYYCVKCDFKITLKKSIEDKATDFIKVLDSFEYEDAEIINIDGELIRVQREEKKDKDYWIDVKMSKNKKGELQLMVLAGSKKSKDKAHLFLEPKSERLAFDQNNDHPSQIFTKVVGIFKNSKSKICSKDKD
jgi:hypothetical protein